MKFIYALLYAVFNGKQQLPVYNVSNQKKYSAKLFLPIGLMLVLALSLPQIGFAQTPSNWVGGASGGPKNWNKAANWSTGTVPDATTDITIPAGLSNYPTTPAPVLPSYGTTLTVHSITILANTPVTVLKLLSGYTLQIGGNITTNGGLIDATSGIIITQGSTAQSFGGSDFVSSAINTLFNFNTDLVSGLTISNSLNITAELSLGDYSILTTNNNLTLVSNATSGTAVVAPIDEDLSGSGVSLASIVGNVTVQRYYPAHRRWRLITAPVQSSGAPTISAAWQEGGQSIAGSVSNPKPGFGTHISGPTTGAFVSSTGYDQSPTNSPSIGYPMTANSWHALPNTTSTSVTAYQGYMLFVRGDRSYPIYTSTVNTLATSTILRTTGALNVGQVTVPVNSGFTIIGNPYAATINFNNVYDFDSSALTSNSFSLWDPNIGSTDNLSTNGTGGWVTLSWNGNGYDASPNTALYDGFDVSGDIQSGAAFAVDGARSGSVVIDETAKVSDETDDELFLFRPSNNTNTTLSQPTAPASILRTTLYATDTAHVQTYLADGVLNEFGSSYSNNVSWNKDVKKLFNLTEKISILKDSQNISIEKSALPVAGDTVHLSVGSLNVSPYQLVIATKNFTRPDIKAFLVDAFDSTSTPILLGDTSVNVNFVVTTVPGSYAANRFSIVFTATPPATVTYSNVTATAVQNKSINVQWQVTNQTNTKDYVVERSIDGTHFTVVDTTAATPTDESSYTYNWVDANAVYGTNYYRIYTIGDNFAIQDTSNIASAVLDAGIITPAGAVASLVNVYPNPVTNGTVNVNLANLPTGNYGIKIISATGDVLLNETIYHVTNSTPIAIPFGQNVSKGVYILEIIDPTGNKTKVTFEN
ncbi:MAG TPA: T9SS type A sorting domain-containing protein [Ferruginibacter sp.]|nr:T9SS type A sorting domain-containing protein [Ferruginibacter sp.]